MLNKIKKECKKHKLCKECPLYYDVRSCLVATLPAFRRKKEIKKILRKEFRNYD